MGLFCHACPAKTVEEPRDMCSTYCQKFNLQVLCGRMSFLWTAQLIRRGLFCVSCDCRDSECAEYKKQAYSGVAVKWLIAVIISRHLHLLFFRSGIRLLLSSKAGSMK